MRFVTLPLSRPDFLVHFILPPQISKVLPKQGRRQLKLERERDVTLQLSLLERLLLFHLLLLPAGAVE